jgi:hypothetical protein
MLSWREQVDEDEDQHGMSRAAFAECIKDLGRDSEYARDRYASAHELPTGHQAVYPFLLDRVAEVEHLWRLIDDRRKTGTADNFLIELMSGWHIGLDPADTEILRQWASGFVARLHAKRD